MDSFFYLTDAITLKNLKQLINTKIKQLSEESSMKVWLHIYGECYDKKTRWFLNKNHWMNSVKIENIVWIDAYNENRFKDIELLFFEKFSYSKESTIFFFDSEIGMIETTWGIFVKYWRNFFSYDDESKIWCIESNRILQIRPYGDIITYKIPF